MVEDRNSKRSEYADPPRSCDIVMKGGITSGVVYPRAVTALAKTFSFRNVGGTSAGAIAAAATAAAEYGREKEGFERLDELPDWIGEKGNLPGLFQPQRPTAGLFRIVLAKVERGSLWAAVVAVARNPLVVALGALPGIALLLLASQGSGALTWAAYVGGALLAALGGLLALLAYLAAKLLRAVPSNGYGLCSGWTQAYEDDESKRGRAPLTPWLSERLDEYAGLPPEEPLTFGHLWVGPGKAREGLYPAPEDRHLELAMMTTNLTNRRAHQLPLSGDGWYFRPSEFRKLFPREVVDWMVDRPPQAPPSEDVRLDDDLLPLPEPQDMPVIVATRMSLSFPVLLSAVPLWRVDASRVATSGEPLRPEPCWFSDGGISSNFPIHFFDKLVPRRPTFAINLRPFRLGEGPREKQRENTWMVASEEQAIDDWWYRFSGRHWLPFKDKRLFEFLAGIGNTMQNRVDEAQMRVPGYRDRIAHVSMTEAEGGMNLTMEEKTIKDLIERGRCAAERLNEAYAGSSEETTVTWDSHRWTRLRSTLAVLEGMQRRFATGYKGKVEPPDAPSYVQMVGRGDSEPPDDYRWASELQRELAERQIEAIEAAVAEVTSELSAETGAPEPLPEGRIQPRG
jgi:predicted acylesterase/phospholipase RssA